MLSVLNKIAPTPFAAGPGSCQHISSADLSRSDGEDALHWPSLLATKSVAQHGTFVGKQRSGVRANRPPLMLREAAQNLVHLKFHFRLGSGLCYS